jgi:hypothetical protein
LACVVAVAALAAAALAGGTSKGPSTRAVVDKGMAGVKLGDAKTRVVQVLGRPDSASKCGSSSIEKQTCGGPGVVIWRYNSPSLTVILIRERVARFSTTSPRFRTAGGIGVGARFGKVKRRYPNGTVGGSPSFRWYFLGKAPKRTGDRYTLVDSASGKLKGKIRDFDIGRWDKKHKCAFFGCA